jgi:hypothetical protein
MFSTIHILVDHLELLQLGFQLLLLVGVQPWALERLLHCLNTVKRIAILLLLLALAL